MSSFILLKHSKLIHNKLINYRPEVDGLRALAVLSVLVYHAFPGWLPGGFVGVDVFFVISGYLITKIIYKEVTANKFSLFGFYTRRARRIFPALILVISVCLVGGWFLLLTSEFQELGQHSFFSSLFSQNINLIFESNYFDSPAKGKVLLHLWSLAVEEQFYLIWPLVILLLVRYSRVQLGIFVIVVLSFAYCIVMTYKNQTLAFYLPFTRFWELGLGGVVAFYEVENKLRTATSRALPWVGTAILVLSFIFINDHQLFPGWIVFFPVAGTLMIIAGSSQAWISERVLSNKVAVFIGLISYPLYLWHWPLLAYLNIYFIQTPLREYRAAALLISFVLATVTYLYIEKPVRHSKMKFTPAILMTTLFFLGIFGATVYVSNGVANRSVLAQSDPHAMSQIRIWEYWQNPICESRYPFQHKKGGWWFCIQNSDDQPTVLLLGNSHANDLYPGLISSDAFKHHVVLSIGTCSPEKPNVNERKHVEYDCDAEEQIQQYDFINELIETERPSFVIINSSWPNNDNRSLTALDNFVSRLSSRISLLESKGSKVILTLPRPKLHTHIRNCYHRPFKPASSDCKTQEKIARNEFSEISLRLISLASVHENLSIFDPFPLFCDNGICDFHTDAGPLIRDAGTEHLSLTGSRIYAESLALWAESNLPSILLQPE